MNTKASKIFALFLAICLVLSMVPMMPASAAGTLASYYSTNAAGTGAKKTITVDGDISDWNSSMLIAQGTANDDPRVYRPNSMYEIPIDMYAQYCAYDNENLYLMWEMTNVQDVVAPNDTYPLSQGVLFQTMNVPFFIAIDTGDNATAIGNDGALTPAAPFGTPASPSSRASTSSSPSAPTVPTAPSSTAAPVPV